MWLSLQQDFLHFLRFEKRYSAHTLLSYENDLKQCHAFLGTEFEGLDDPREVKLIHLRSWMAALRTDKKMAATSINRKRSALSAFFNYLLKHGHVGGNPARALHSLRLPERVPAALRNSETELLLDEVEFAAGFRGATDRMICELLYGTGIRRAELIALKETDVEWSGKQLRVFGKGGKERLIPLPEGLLDALRHYRSEKRKLDEADEERLLVLSNGKPLYDGYVYRTVRKYLGAVTSQDKKSPHVLRHSFATHLLNNGAAIGAIKDLLGHSSLAATQIYTHSNIDQLKDVHRKRHPRG